MVKRVDVLDSELAREADGPYEDQPLARRAPAARRRVLGLLLVGLVALLVEAAIGRSGWAVAALLFVALSAFLLHRQRLGGIVGAALSAVLAILVPLGLIKVATLDAAFWFRSAVSLTLGIAALPDLLTLVRDAELQYAYGLWAKRDDE